MRGLLVLAVVLTGCADGLTVLVDLRTDLAPADEFAVVETSLTTPGRAEPLEIREVGALRSYDFSARRRVAEFRGLAPGAYSLRVRALDADGDEVVARVVALELHADQAVTVVITRDCRGVSCPGAGDTPTATTCFAGRCVEPGCVLGEAACGRAECAVDLDCPRLAACATPRCVGGGCFAETELGACGAASWCNVEIGCVTVSAPDAAFIDAGPASNLEVGRPDGGPSDAGRDSSRDTGCSGECTAGDVRTAPCERCGTITQTCDATCHWGLPTGCLDMGECEAGSTAESVGGRTCGTCQAFECDATCHWSTTCSGCGCPASLSMCLPSCPAGYHPASYGCTSTCGACGGGALNVIDCQPNCGASFSSCRACPTGYRPVSTSCSSGCGSCTGGDNIITCVQR